MSITSEITRIKTNISNAYGELEAKGATIPTEKNSENLADTINTVPSGGKFAPRYVSFYGCKLSDIQQEIEAIDILNLSSLEYCFMSTSISEIDLSSWVFDRISMKECFHSAYSTNIILPSVSVITTAERMFENARNITTIDLSSVGEIRGSALLMFGSCNNLTAIDLSETKLMNVTNPYSMFDQCKKLEILKLSEGFGTKFEKNYSLSLTHSTLLTRESILDVINNIGVVSAANNIQLQLGSTNIAKLTAEEIAIATAKGWTVS